MYSPHHLSNHYMRCVYIYMIWYDFLIIIRRSLEKLYTRGKKKSADSKTHIFLIFCLFHFVICVCPLVLPSYFTFSIIFLLSFPKTLKYTKLCPRECPIYMTSVTHKFVGEKRCHKDETWWLLGFPHIYLSLYIHTQKSVSGTYSIIKKWLS